MPWSAAAVLTAAQLNLYAPQAFTTFAPNFVNLPLTGGSSYAAYKEYGDLTIVQFAVVASGVATGTISMSLPTTAVIHFGTSNQVQAWGMATATDVSVPKSWPMVIRCNSSTSVAFLLPDGSNNANATSPFTWVSGDTFAGSFSYESVP